MAKTTIEEITIQNPIGNLYRKKHVLIFIEDINGNLILGSKKDFYPANIDRMLGGGMEEGEEPITAAKREIEEETALNIPIDFYSLLGSVKTKAHTSEGSMEMETWICHLKFSESMNICPSDDISDIKVYTPDQYRTLIERMRNLSGEFKTEKFSFLWLDWGKIYAPIHQAAILWAKSKKK